MRILTVSHFYESHGGGIERVAGQLNRQFTRLNVEAVWAASDADLPPDSDVETVPLRCVNPIEKVTGLPMPIPGWRAVRALAREVRRSDAVLVHDALYVTSILALLMAKARRKRVILIQHIAGIPFSSRILRGVMRFANIAVTRPMLRAADERVFISDTVRETLLGARPRMTSTLLFNGVDTSVFYPAKPAAAPNSVSEIIVPRGTRRMLFVGRYVEKKGLKIVRALAELRPDLSFFLAGSGFIRPSAWGLANVHDLGPQSSEALADLYRWADLLVLPSVGEGYPLVIQEAMACGLPVVCGAPSDRADPDASQWMRGVGIDLTAPETSAERCSAAIDTFKPSDAERAAMARYAQSRYDWRAMAERLIALAQAPPPTALA